MSKENISGRRIAQALEERNMRAIDLADRTGISRGAISCYISGKYKAKQDKLYKMSKALGVNPAWLMGYDVDMTDSLQDDYSYLPEYPINDIELSKSIGLKIKNARINKGLTLKELGNRIGISESTAQRYEQGDIKNISIKMLKEFAFVLDITPAYLMGWKEDIQEENPKGVKIPVLGSVAAGVPITAISNIEDYEEITEDMARQGEYFALRIKGDSMSPLIRDGNIVIVRKQAYIDTGDVAVVLVNGDEATVKEIKKTKEGITLIGWNPSVYTPKFYSKEEIEKLPVDIVGKVVESRAKF